MPLDLPTTENALLVALLDKFARPDQQRLLRQLSDKATRGRLKLAKLLASCSLVAPCGSGACPICGTRLQVATYELAKRSVLAEARALRDRSTVFTFVPSIGSVPPGELSVLTFKAVTAVVTASVAKHHLAPSIFVLDISFNEDASGAAPPHWCIHTHGLKADWLSAAEKKAVSNDFASSVSIRRPVVITELDKRINGKIYPLKILTSRRVTDINNRQRANGRRPHRDTHSRSLRREQAVELVKVIHQLGLRARVLTFGISENLVERQLGGFNWARDGPK